MSCLLFAFSFVLLPYLGLGQTCGKCPSGFTYFSDVNKCYKAFSTKQTWDKALLTCRGLNSHLATVMSLCTNNALNTVVQSFKSLCNNPDLSKPTFWTAGRRRCSNDSFVWMPSRGVVVDMPYTNWLKGEPNNLKGVEDCVHFLANDNKDFVWNDSVCDLPNCFVCQVDL